MRRILYIFMVLAAISCGGRKSASAGHGTAAARGAAQGGETVVAGKAMGEMTAAGEAPVEEALKKISESSRGAKAAEEPQVSSRAVRIAEGIEIDRTVVDFGDFLLSDGPKSCSFTVTNRGAEPLTILEVISSCGCTGATWTRDPIQPLGKGKIEATYKNEDGPIPFDKTLTVYFSSLQKPVLLHLRGVPREKSVPLEESYGAFRCGDIGFKSAVFKAGNLEQGGAKSEETTIANLGKKPVKVTFTDIDSDLSLTVEPNPVPARSTARLIFTVTADREKWGRNEYMATPRAGSVTGAPLTFWAITKEDFSSLTQEEKANASRPVFKESTSSFGRVKRGTVVKGTFSFKNVGKTPFRCYKVDSDAPVEVSAVPELAPGEEGTVTATLDTATLPEGEVSVILTLTTNSPLRPIVNLFLVGDTGK